LASKVAPTIGASTTIAAFVARESAIPERSNNAAYAEWLAANAIDKCTSHSPLAADATPPTATPAAHNAQPSPWVTKPVR
jgi:hypothetical protein